MLASIRRVRITGKILLLQVVWALGTMSVFAHDPGLSTATIQIKSNKLEAVLTFSLVDAAQIAELDKNHDGDISQNELAGGVKALEQKGLQALEVGFDGELMKPLQVKAEFDELQNATVSLVFPARPYSKLVITSKWMSVLPPGHRQFVTLKDESGEVLAERLLAANMAAITVLNETERTSPAVTNRSNSFTDFLLMGVKHIWTGYDHLLFLFGLLLVTRNFSSSVKIITCFTIAHSITLAVATLSLVQIPSRIVEPLIAASIVYVGLENLLRGDDPKGRWLLTLAFGLIHGFGFASVLRELGVGSTGASIAIPLVSFNLGVEIGQIVVAGLVLPVIWKLRTRPVFLRLWVPAGSVLIALLGSYWFIERVRL